VIVEGVLANGRRLHVSRFAWGIAMRTKLV